MLAILPLAAFLGIFLVLGNQRPEEGWRLSFLRAAIIWGTFTILATEALSFFRGITPLGLTLTWFLPITAAVIWLLRRARRGERLHLPAIPKLDHWGDWLLAGGVGLVLVLTALVAWIAPPHTWDSLRYHMPRVAHWAQMQAVRHFATGMEVQNSMAPGPEISILHFYVLLGGDRLANFVSWFAMFGSLVGASRVARELGAGRLGQLLAMVVAATIPMGIVEASSTMTDYIVTFWLVCAAAEILGIYNRVPEWRPVLFLSLAAGLALVSKPIAVAYLIPLGLLAGLILLRRVSQGQTLKWAGVAVLAVLVLNAGHYTRNFISYGNPITRAEEIGLHSNQLRTIPGVTSNLLRNAALHTGFPVRPVSDFIYESILKAHIKLGLDLNDPRTTTAGTFHAMRNFSTQETTTGNLIHAFLILVVFFLTLFYWRRLGLMAVIYSLTVAATFLLFSVIFKWQIFGSRYHLPFFVLYAPLIGYVFGKLFRPGSSRVIGFLLLIGALPWLLSINSRPLLPIPERAYVGSILVEPRERLYYANGLGWQAPFTNMLNMIKDVQCTEVGVAISGSGAEYPLWAFLGSPRTPLEIEWLVADSAYSARYEKPDFQPCAVVCQKCPEEWETVRGLPIAYNEPPFRLYLTK